MNSIDTLNAFPEFFSRQILVSRKSLIGAQTRVWNEPGRFRHYRQSLFVVIILLSIHVENSLIFLLYLSDCFQGTKKCSFQALKSVPKKT